jgi:DNA-binding response OmpR family regulator
VKAVLRRTKPKEANVGLIDDGAVKLNLNQHRLEINGKVVDLSPKEFDLLAALMRTKNTVLTRETLCESVWGHELVGNTRTVDVHVGRLRKKIEPFDNRIETVERIGYRYLPEKV